MAEQEIRPGRVEFSLDVAHFLGRFPLLARIGVEVDDVVARLVAVGVHADQARNVHRSLFSQIALGGEEFVEFGREGPVAAHQGDQSFGMLRHEERVLPAVALAEVSHAVDRLERIVGREPLAVFEFRTDEIDRLVEIVRVVFSALEVFLVIGCIAELFGHLRHAPVAYGVFHGDRGGVGCFVVGNELVFQHIGHGVLQRIGHGRFTRPGEHIN